MRMTYALVCLAVLLASGAASARDGWEGRPLVCDMSPGPTLERCQAWISTVQRPDLRGASCCGVGDAYVTDDFRVDPATGDLYAIFSFDYPVDQNGAGGYRKGDEILIPTEKRNHLPEDAGNTSGHGVTFIAGGAAICYFAPPLT